MSVFSSYATYYDLLYKDKKYDEESRYVLDLATRFGGPVRTILNIGSGTGAHDTHWLNEGVRVHGVDQSEKMVEHARARNSRHVSEGNAVYFCSRVQDLRPNETFDLVTSIFHVMSYLNESSEVQDAFDKVTQCLKPRGLFIFDSWYGPCVLSEPPKVKVKRLGDGKIEITRLTEPTLRSRDNVVDVRFTIQSNHLATRKYEEIVETHSMRYFFLPEIAWFAEKAGLRLIHSEEFLTKKDLDPHTFSSVFVLQKV